MGGNQNHHNQHYVHNDDSFAKVKFSISHFNGSYDIESYLDWEMTVEQKFSSHLVTEQHRVRQATSEFKDFALIWWNKLATLRLQPHTWDRLKIVMH
jgi:N-acetyl-anhydromuramyl-L-alanine amidase AmpD